MHTHMLINAAGRAVYEVTPDVRNAYPVADLVALPANYWAADYASVWTWSGRIVAEDPAKVEALMVAKVKAEAEARRMLVMSPGGSKKTVYSLKQAEVERWNGLATTALAMVSAFLGLAPVEQNRKFRFALTDAKRRGEANPAAAIARFQAGADASNAEAARIEAIEQAGVASIKAAASAAAKRAAYVAINWSWAPA